MKIVFTQAEVRDVPQPDQLLFIEVEDNGGHSKSWGEWQKHQDGLHEALVIGADALIEALGDELLELEHRNALEQLLIQQTTPHAWQRLTPDELNFLKYYRAQRGVYEAGLKIDSDLVRRVAAKADVDPLPIPAGVYYHDGNFYNAATHEGMGEAFYYRWRDRAKEFPKTREAAIEAMGDSGTSSSQSDGF